ncbi:MAG: MBL fold metallo-hydrolase, partial [Halieaceae bacterium]|nr:MBL fold metallo-hydrolase [Halieaceae bacterium]
DALPVAEDAPVEPASVPGEIPARPGWWSELPRPAWQDFEPVKTLNPWFEVYEVQRGIFAIYEPGQKAETISWLIVGDTQALLYDTGLGMGDIRSVVRQLTNRPIVVLNSHAHYAHVGGNHQFRTILALNHPFVLERAKGIPKTAVGENAVGDAIWKTAPPDFNALDYAIQPWSFARWVEDGQTLDLGGVQLQVYHLPGHTPDNLVLLDRARRLLFTGGSFALDRMDLSGADSDVLMFADSAAKLASLAEAVDLLLLSHRVPLAEGRYLLDLDRAMQGILNNSAPFRRIDGGREYPFTAFTIVTPDPPLSESALIEAL